MDRFTEMVVYAMERTLKDIYDIHFVVWYCQDESPPIKIEGTWTHIQKCYSFLSQDKVIACRMPRSTNRSSWTEGRLHQYGFSCWNSHKDCHDMYKDVIISTQRSNLLLKTAHLFSNK